MTLKRNLISDRVIWYHQPSWWLKLASVKEFLCQSHSLWSRLTFETLKHFMVANFRYQLSWWYQITLLYSPTDVAWPQFSKKSPPSWFQIGLAVGDIDTIRKTAALERYTSQVCRIQRICYHFCEESVGISYNVMKKNIIPAIEFLPKLNQLNYEWLSGHSMVNI